jgi:Skp family chaperone for outer membrane proteins
MTDSQMITQIYASVQSMQTELKDFKEQVKKDNESMREDIDNINRRLDKFEERLSNIERKPGDKAQLIIDTVIKFVGLGIIGYIGKLIVDKL